MEGGGTFGAPFRLLRTIIVCGIKGLLCGAPGKAQELSAGRLKGSGFLRSDEQGDKNGFMGLFTDSAS